MLNRRKFLQYSAAGLAGSMVPLASRAAHADSIPAENRKKDIIYRTLGKTGIQLPVVSLGVMRVDNPNLVRSALDGGIIHLDTANGYQQGRNEEMLGNLLTGRPRDSFVITTKIHPREPISTEEFLSMLNTSLKRLKLDYVDMLYLHAVDNRDYMFNENYLNALAKAKKEGKARFVGLSTHSNMAKVLRWAVESKFYEVVLTSYNFMMHNDSDMHAALEEAGRAGLGIIAMKTMAGGGYWDREKTQKINTRAALKWALQNPNIHTAIPGCTTFDQLEENLSVMSDITLTEEELRDLRLTEPMHREEGKETSSLFCFGCRTCEKQCVKHLPLPELMRAYMYTYGYRDMALAREVIDNSSHLKGACAECSACTVSCPHGLPVAQRVRDVERLADVPREFLV